MSRRKVCDSGTMAAPNTPCMRRKKTIDDRLHAPAQATEAATKPAMEIRKNSFRPMRSEIQPVSGVMIAAATI